MPVKDLAAIILSAGFSSRMADFKPLLPLGDSTVIENAVNIFKRAGIENITVVAGHRAEELKAVLERINVNHVLNERYSEGMFSSVVKGLSSLGPNVKAAFLLPVDIPLVRNGTIVRMAQAYGESGPHIYYPTFGKERGHPPLIPAHLFREIISWKGTGGLQAFLELHESESVEIEVSDEGMLLDIDTREDYEDICRIYKKEKCSSRTSRRKQ
jgi:molybdenum cofactor cytidylyltransferase